MAQLGLLTSLGPIKPALGRGFWAGPGLDITTSSSQTLGQGIPFRHPFGTAILRFSVHQIAVSVPCKISVLPWYVHVKFSWPIVNVPSSSSQTHESYLSVSGYYQHIAVR